MPFTASKLNLFLLFKLPSAYLCGVRARNISETECIVGVTHRWINQNPFNSMYFAVQAMAAELSSGALVMYHIKEKNRRISMLVASNKSSFMKKATGRIIFTCADGKVVCDAIERAVATGEGQTFWMKSIGVNEAGIQVSEFDFEWTIKAK
ncbi:MAG TPA: DUF4442 domain-containing protein [Flavobacterium sp.]|jgi:transcriptional regulator with AAA-type ATPase domain